MEVAHRPGLDMAPMTRPRSMAHMAPSNQEEVGKRGVAVCPSSVTAPWALVQVSNLPPALSRSAQAAFWAEMSLSPREG